MRAVRSTGSGVELVEADEPVAVAWHGVRVGGVGAAPVSGLSDVVVEAAGSLSALHRAVELAAPGGCLVMLGVHVGPVEMPFLPMLLKEVRLVPSIAYGAHAGDRDMVNAAGMLAANPKLAATLITHRFPLENAARAFEVAADRSHGAIGVVVEID